MIETVLKIKLLIIGLLLLVILAYILGKPPQLENIPETPPKQHQGYLVSNDVGYVANTFSWGYNRHICYDPEYETWWIFYYRSNSNTNRPTQAWIVYRYSKDDGKSWSNEIRFEGDKPQSADLTIDCTPPNVSIAYGDSNQSSVLWKKGILDNETITWITSSTAIVSKPFRSFSHVAPSLIYYKSIPAVAVRDQSEEGGNRRVFVAIAKDPNGNKWNEKVTLFDAPINRLDNMFFVTPSLIIAKDSLYALINSGHNMYISMYLDDNRWTEARRIPDFATNGSLDWSTVTDTTGVLHVFYPEEAGFTTHATFDGQRWNFENIGSKKNSIRQISASIDADNNLYLISNNLVLRQFVNGQWTDGHSLLTNKDSQIIYTNTLQFVNGGRLGIAWVEGEEKNPHIWFICLKKIAPQSLDFLKKC